MRGTFEIQAESHIVVDVCHDAVVRRRSVFHRPYYRRLVREGGPCVEVLVKRALEPRIGTKISCGVDHSRLEKVFYHSIKRS